MLPTLLLIPPLREEEGGGRGKEEERTSSERPLIRWGMKDEGGEGEGTPFTQVHLTM